MSAPATIKYDAPFNFVRPEQDGPRRTTYPFIRNGDNAARIYNRDLVVQEQYYVPPILGTAKDSDWPAGDPQAYALKDPEEPPYVGIGDLIRIPRRYARIPGPQVSYPGSRYFPLPGVSGLGTSVQSQAVDWVRNNPIGSAFYLTDSNRLFIESSNSFYGAMKLQTGRLIGVASGGTFTLTYGASTTGALNWNDSNATIKAAIDGLASVMAVGITSTVTNLLSTATGGQLGVAWSDNTATPITMNAGSLTVTTSANTTTVFQSSAVQFIFLPDHYTITSHGLNPALALAVRTVQANVVNTFSAGNWGSIGANTIWISNLTSTNYGVLFGTFTRSYFPGKSYLLRTRITENFYLPGVTPGITTAADIPIVTGLQNPADFINALLTLTGWQTYETEGPAFWLDGPIYRTAYTAINLDDVT